MISNVTRNIVIKIKIVRNHNVNENFVKLFIDLILFFNLIDEFDESCLNLVNRFYIKLKTIRMLRIFFQSNAIICSFRLNRYTFK